MRSYTIKIFLIRSYTIKIHLIRSYTIKIPLIRSYTTNILIRQKFLKYVMFFILKTIQSWSQALDKKLQHATLKSQSNKEKKNLYCLLRLLRSCKNDYFSGRGFLRSGDYQTRLKNFLQRPKLSWTAKFSHSTQLRLTIRLPPKQNQQAFFCIIIG